MKWDKPLRRFSDCRKLVKRLAWEDARRSSHDPNVLGQSKATLDLHCGPHFHAKARAVSRAAGWGIPRRERWPIPIVRWTVKVWVLDGTRVISATARNADSRWAGAFAALTSLVLIRHPWRFG